MNRGATLIWLGGLGSACGTAGSQWMAEPLPSETWKGGLSDAERRAPAAAPSSRAGRAVQVIGGHEPTADATPESASNPAAPLEVSSGALGKSLGTFRNTYYDFPSEADFTGVATPLKNPNCETIRQVPRGFFESVCVQGSGTLSSGKTVSFSKRDCACAESCPKTGEHICFDALDPKAFPWGRGATGKAIVPLLSVAVDTDVIELGTPIYIPELDGLPRDDSGGASHDGCFIAQDRGIRVKGRHVDVFTGHSSVTALWNRLLPSNRGVTVIVDSPRCQRAKPGSGVPNARE